MPAINPDTLRKLRERRRLTLDQLAEESKLDKQSIHRLEKGKRGRVRELTLTNLAKALGVEKNRLIAPLADGDEPEAVSAAEVNKSQLNLRVSAQARNALLLASERFHVKPAQIVELAPFLFYWAAEKCLRQRKQRLDNISQQSAEISERVEAMVTELDELIDGALPLVSYWKDDELNEALVDEYADIAFHYLFGEFGGSPIADFLAQLASELGGEADFEGWESGSSPAYHVCKEEAAWLADGDAVALESILEGHAPLHELPREVWEDLRRGDGLILAEADEVEKIQAERRKRKEERVKWIREHSKRDPDGSPEAVS